LGRPTSPTARLQLWAHNGRGAGSGRRAPWSDRRRRAGKAERLTLRLRNVSRDGVATGSGFAIGRHTVITNRHVRASADQLELDTWDGRSMTAEVGAARTGRLVDIGLAVVPERLAQVASFGLAPTPGDGVTAAGDPLGRPLTLSSGRVVRYRDGRRLDLTIAFDGQVIESQARQLRRALPDADGRAVGVVYALLQPGDAPDRRDVSPSALGRHARATPHPEPSARDRCNQPAPRLRPAGRGRGAQARRRLDARGLR
jgi:S1-C subfamily serine protease